MKKITTIIAIVFMTLNAFAQKPVKGDMGMTAGFNGLANLGVSTTTPTGTLLFRYYLKDDMAARLSLNFTNRNFSTSFTDDSSDVFTSSNKSSSWAIAIGAQKSFGTIKNIEPYFALDIYVGSGKSNVSDSETVFKNGDFVKTMTEPGSTFSWGVTPSVGFNWFFVDHFAIGAEFGWGISASSTKEGISTYSTKFGSTTVTTTNRTATSKGTYIGGSGSGMITFSVFFD